MKQSKSEPTRVPGAVLREKLLEVFEANYLDGDKMQPGQMISSTEILDFITDDCMALFEATMLEIIGKDDIPFGNELYPAKKGAVERNELRKEQRSHLYKLLGRGEES